MMYLLRVLVFVIIRLHMSCQNQLLPRNLEPIESNKEVEEWFYDKRTSTNYSKESTMDLSPSEYVKVYIHSRKTVQNYFEIIYGNLSSFENSDFDIHKPTKMLIHGWMANALGNKSFEEELRTTYLAAQDVNVLSVDWSRTADDVVYSLARAKVVPVGKFVAKFIDWLVSEAEVVMESIHVIGHSLGAHISGVVGEHVTVGNISRITGLDPAGPGFSNSSISGRLDSSDAEFVDVIHTCAPYLGFYDACGHVDFYPNKGEPPQPGCDIPLMLSCSHIRSHDLFNESIISTEFLAWQCEDWQGFSNGSCVFNNMATMGEHVDIKTRGIFYLFTNSSYPYALGDFRNENQYSTSIHHRKIHIINN